MTATQTQTQPNAAALPVKQERASEKLKFVLTDSASALHADAKDGFYSIGTYAHTDGTHSVSYVPLDWGLSTEELGRFIGLAECVKICHQHFNSQKCLKK